MFSMFLYKHKFKKNDKIICGIILYTYISNTHVEWNKQINRGDFFSTKYKKKIINHK